VARKAMARKCTAEIAGNVQVKVERQHRAQACDVLLLSSQTIRY